MASPQNPVESLKTFCIRDDSSWYTDLCVCRATISRKNARIDCDASADYVRCMVPISDASLNASMNVLCIQGKVAFQNFTTWSCTRIFAQK